MKKKFLENIILPLGDQLTGGSFIKKLKYWREVCDLSQNELNNLQKEKLSKILEFASSNSPFYKALAIPHSSDPYEWLANFPILKKQQFRDHLSQFLTTNNLEGLTAITSSGSTGPPSKIYFNKEELSSNRALQILWWEWAGYRFGNSILQTGVNMQRSKEKAIKDKLLNTRYISAMSHSEAEILRELRLLQKSPRDHFVAYASSLYLFAKTSLDHGISNIQFKSIISLGEKLLPHFREAIERAFSCQVFDTYGASEGFLIAGQCSEGTYHIYSPHLIVEILDDQDQEVNPGESGRVVLTGLDNFTTPLIRYEVGDMAVKSKIQKCSCGMNLPILGEVIGRQTEFLLTPKGKYITVQNVVRIMKHFPEIGQFKLVQEVADRIRLIYTTDEQIQEIDHSKILGMFEEIFEEPLGMEFNRVYSLPKAKTGKFQLIENNLGST